MVPSSSTDPGVCVCLCECECVCLCECVFCGAGYHTVHSSKNGASELCTVCYPAPQILVVLLQLHRSWSVCVCECVCVCVCVSVCVLWSWISHSAQFKGTIFCSYLFHSWPIRTAARVVNNFFCLCACILEPRIPRHHFLPISVSFLAHPNSRARCERVCLCWCVAGPRIPRHHFLPLSVSFAAHPNSRARCEQFCLSVLMYLRAENSKAPFFALICFIRGPSEQLRALWTCLSMLMYSQAKNSKAPFLHLSVSFVTHQKNCARCEHVCLCWCVAGPRVSRHHLGANEEEAGRGQTEGGSDDGLVLRCRRRPCPVFAQE
jgi:hypothetical protein